MSEVYNIKYLDDTILEQLNGLKLYNSSSYEKVASEMLPNLANGSISGSLINQSSNSYELNIPTSDLFTKMYGNVSLKYTLNSDGTIVIDSVEPQELFINASNVELVEYNGIMISKENYDSEKEKVDKILAEINNTNNSNTEETQQDNSDSNEGSNSDSSSGSNGGSNSGSNTDSDSGSSSGTNTGSDSGSSSGTNTGSDSGSSSGTNTDSDSESSSGTNTDSDSESSSGTNTGSESESNAESTDSSSNIEDETKTLEYAIKNNYTFDSGTLASDASVIYSSMSDIQNSINSYVLGTCQSSGNSCQSESNIPRNLYIMQSDIISAGMTLSNKLNYETSLIANIADVIYQMDSDLATKSESLNSQVDVLYSSDILSQAEALVNYCSEDSITFKSNLFTSTNSEGKVGKICMDDINNMLSGNSLTGNLASNFEYERSSSELILSKLNDFLPTLESYSALAGDSENNVWENVSNKISGYCDLLNNRIKANDELEAAYVEALTLIKNYMGEYTELDDSKLPSLREYAEELTTKINNDKAIINDYTGKFKDTLQEDGSTKKVWYPTYSSEDKTSAQNRINENTPLLEKTQEEITLLEGLPAIMNQAEEIINTAFEHIKTYYCDDVSNKTTGKEASYEEVNFDEITNALPETDDENSSELYKDGTLVSSQNSKLSLYAVETNGVIDYYYNNEELAEKYGIFIKDKEYQQRAWNNQVNAVSSYWNSIGGFGPNGCTVCSTCEAISNVLQEEVLPTNCTTMKQGLAYARENGCTVTTMKSGGWSKEVAIEILEQGGQIIHAKTLEGGKNCGHFYTVVGYDSETDTFLTFEPYVTQTERTNKPLDTLTGTGYHEFTWEEYLEDRNGGTGGTITIVSKEPITLSCNEDDNPNNNVNLTIKNGQ